MQQFKKFGSELLGLVYTGYIAQPDVGSRPTVEMVDSERRSRASLEEDLECPVCWERFNDLENTPYVLWCGHTLCRECVMGLQGAHVKVTALCWQLPFFISCPWCQFLTLRLTWKGCLRYPCKNFFLLGIIDTVRGSSKSQQKPLLTDHVGGDAGSFSSHCRQQLRSRLQQRHVEQELSVITRVMELVRGGWNLEVLHGSYRRVCAFFSQITSKLPLVCLLLFLVIYLLPLSIGFILIYAAITIIFAVPSLLVVYFSFPSLNWLIQEIMT
ncbi:hypothetical protein O6H91_01G143100 [Diphasiastrum complanatum]|uniref:Uncharacterized protein n=1 Tax=Diphasiastrum complanatum TaxID=34168 RepID=A0ACC2EWT6_DIPCM|nr:hypothetical protein O6H91_01G143100 [Diphasiastrum complanatum]